MRRRSMKVAAAISVAMIATGVAASESQAVTIRIAGTSDLFDSGVFQNVMSTMYNATSPFFVAGDTLKYQSVGTGKALTTAENGFADLVLVHSPPLENNFVTGGYSAEGLGRSLLYNDYVIVGPTGDPANVAQNARHDGVLAIQKIAAFGATNNATFVSRNDASGTNVQEETMWGQTTGVTLQTAQNAGGVTGLFQPATTPGGPGYPTWYARQTAAAQQTQAANLLSTATCDSAFAPKGGCYTMTDRGTLVFLQAQGKATGLTIVSSDNSSTAVGGPTELLNPFHAYIVTAIDPATGGNYPFGATQPNVTAATRFVNFLTGATGASGVSGKETFTPAFQNAITSYLATDNGGNPIFHPDAFPQAVSQAPLPAGGSVRVNHPFTLHANLVYSPADPTLGHPVVAIPYSFNVSTDNGATWTSVGHGVSNTAGLVSVNYTPTATGTVLVQLFTPTFNQTNIATKFSPYENTASFGPLTVNP